jgi:hypothetical protein
MLSLKPFEFLSIEVPGVCVQRKSSHH